MGRGYYIIGIDRRDCYNVGIKDPRMSKYHQRIQEELKGDGVRRNLRYCNLWPICLIVAPKRVPRKEGETRFSNLKNEFKKPTRTAQEKSPWISEATWRLGYQRTPLRLIHAEYQQELRKATRRLQPEL